MKKYLLETCVDSLESAVIADRAGTQRIELCANLCIGGTTPSTALFKQVKENCKCGIHVLIRPRFGDFCYSEDELMQMRAEIREFKELGADGVAIGVLNEEGELDKQAMEFLMQEAQGISVTLHRAFDMTKDAFSALEDAVSLGIDAILTSGQQDKCVDGIELLTDLAKRASGRIDIIAGSGVNASVIEVIAMATDITSYHMSGKVTYDSPMKYRSKSVHMGLEALSEYERYRTSKEKIEKAVKAIYHLEQEEL